MLDESTQGVITKKLDSIKGAERCDGYDNDENGIIDDGFDLDNDGFPSCRIGKVPRDCNDNDNMMNAGVSENCGDSIDNDCDGKIDSADDECSSSCLQSLQSAQHCLSLGVCAGVQAKCAGGTSTCDYGAKPSYQEKEFSCNDNQDNDCDGQTDAQDSDCQQFGVCTSADTNPQQCGRPGVAHGLGVCQGELMECMNGYWNCNYTSINGFEFNENSVDQVDNDCDGEFDEQSKTFDDHLPSCDSLGLDWNDLYYEGSKSTCDSACQKPCSPCAVTGLTKYYCSSSGGDTTSTCALPNEHECNSGEKGCSSDGLRKWYCGQENDCRIREEITCDEGKTCVGGECVSNATGSCSGYDRTVSPAESNIGNAYDRCSVACGESKECEQCSSDHNKYRCDNKPDPENPNTCSSNKCANPEKNVGEIVCGNESKKWKCECRDNATSPEWWWLDDSACCDGFHKDGNSCVADGTSGGGNGCSASCSGKTCGDGDGCGGVCHDGSGCNACHCDTYTQNQEACNGDKNYKCDCEGPSHWWVELGPCSTSGGGGSSSGSTTGSCTCGSTTAGNWRCLDLSTAEQCVCDGSNPAANRPTQQCSQGQSCHGQNMSSVDDLCN